MAVHIPVVIDIDQAFQDAAERVGTAMKPLQATVDANTLKLRLHIDDKSTMSLDKMLKNASVSTNQLKTALADVDAKIMKIASTRKGFDMVNGLTDREKKLLEAYGVLQQKIYGVGNTSTMTQKILTLNIRKVTVEIEKLKAKLKTVDKGTTAFKNINSKLVQAKQNVAALKMQFQELQSQGGMSHYLRNWR